MRDTEQLEMPRDELKRKFWVDEDERKEKQPEVKVDKIEQRAQGLQQEIREMQDKYAPKWTPPEGADPMLGMKTEEQDLNGIKPRDLVVGAATYSAAAVVAWAFTNGVAVFFANKDFSESAYFVQRLSSVAKNVLVATGALGVGVSSIAAAGQLALAVRIWIGIANGELDPNAVRDDPKGRRKKEKYEMMLGYMKGDKTAGQNVDLGRVEDYNGNKLPRM